MAKAARQTCRKKFRRNMHLLQQISRRNCSSITSGYGAKDHIYVESSSLQAFKRLKAALYSSPVLSYSLPHGKSNLDASKVGLAAVLSHIEADIGKVVEEENIYWPS